MATTILSTKIREAVYKIPDHVNYIMTTEFNRLTVETFTAMLILIINYQALISKILQIKQKKTKRKLNSLIRKDYNFFISRIYLMDCKTRFFIE